MLIKEILEENRDLVKYYSDAGVMIHKVGTDEYYGEAIELAITDVTYEETNVPIDEFDGETNELDEVEDMRNALEILGVTDE